MNNNTKLILSLFDYTTNWAQPYIKAGYPVICWDIEYEGCLLESFGRLLSDVEDTGLQVYGIIGAPPCTVMAGSGAWTWRDKDSMYSIDTFEQTVWASWTEKDSALYYIFLEAIAQFNPHFWALENPVGRLESVIPEFKAIRQLLFNPCDYGDPYTKKTILYGNFNNNLPKNPVEPFKVCAQGSWIQKLGGKSKKTKQLRSATPLGFANSFFQANQ